jgi:hypothetical protein
MSGSRDAVQLRAELSRDREQQKYGKYPSALREREVAYARVRSCSSGRPPTSSPLGSDRVLLDARRHDQKRRVERRHRRREDRDEQERAEPRARRCRSNTSIGTIYTGKLSKTPVKPNGHESYIPLPGEWISSHEAIVSTELFATVQKALDTRRPGRKPKDESRILQASC